MPGNRCSPFNLPPNVHAHWHAWQYSDINPVKIVFKDIFNANQNMVRVSVITNFQTGVFSTFNGVSVDTFWFTAVAWKPTLNYNFLGTCISIVTVKCSPLTAKLKKKVRQRLKVKAFVFLDSVRVCFYFLGKKSPQLVCLQHKSKTTADD